MDQLSDLFGLDGFGRWVLIIFIVSAVALIVDLVVG